MRRRIVAITVALLVATATFVELSVTRAQARVPLRITRIFTGTDGLAHVERLDTTFERPQSQPTLGWLESYQAGVTGGNAVILRTSPDYFSEARFGRRGRQYVIMLRGRRELEVANGEKIVVGPGDVLLIEDMVGKGHATRAVGGEEAISVVIPLADQ